MFNSIGIDSLKTTYCIQILNLIVCNLALQFCNRERENGEASSVVVTQNWLKADESGDQLSDSY